MTTDTRVFNPTPETPWVVANLFSLEEAEKAAAKKVEGLEFRYDQAMENGKDPVEELKKIRSNIALPILGTIRRAGDGGAWYYHFQGDENERLNAFEEMMPLVDAIDIEVDSIILKDVIAMASKAGKRVVVSYHNSFGTEDENDIVCRVEEMSSMNFDIIKLAYMVRDADEFMRLYRIVRKFSERDQKISVIGMGEIGAPSRFMFPYLGSCITYGHMRGHPQGAPGQYSIADLQSHMATMKGKFSRDSENEDIFEAVMPILHSEDVAVPA